MSLRPRGLKKWSQVMEEKAHNAPALPPGLEGLGPGVLRPNHPDCRRHTPGEPWGVGRGEGALISDSPWLVVSLRAAGACAACRRLPPKRVPRLDGRPIGSQRVPRWEGLCPAEALTELR